MKLIWIAKKFFNIKLKKRKIYRKMQMKSIYGKSKSNYFLSSKKCLEDLKYFIKNKR